MTVEELTRELGSGSIADEPAHVLRPLAALGRLLGAATAEPPRSLETFAAEHLHVADSDVATVSAQLPNVSAPLVQVVIARLLERAAGTPGLVLANDYGWGAPSYVLVETDVGEQVAAADGLAAYIPAGVFLEIDCVLVVTDVDGNQVAGMRVRRDDRDAARDGLAALIARAKGPANFYRGRTVRAFADDWRYTLTPVAATTTRRAEVVHADAV